MLLHLHGVAEDGCEKETEREGKGGGETGTSFRLRMRDGKVWRFWIFGTAVLRAVRMLVFVMENMTSEVPWTEREGQG